MKKSIIFSGIILCSALIFGACSSEQTQVNSGGVQSIQKSPEVETTKKSTGRKIRVVQDVSYRPMEYIENNELKGFSVDLMRAIGRELGKEIEFSTSGWDEIFDKLYSGECDIACSSVTITDERKKTLLFSDPYFESRGLVVCKETNRVSGLSELSGKKVACQTDSTTLAVLQKNVPGTKLIKSVDMNEVFKFLEKGEVDYVVGDMPIIKEYIKNNKNKNYITVEDDKLLKPEFFGFAADLNNKELIEELNKALEKVKQSKEYQKIYNKYFN